MFIKKFEQKPKPLKDGLNEIYSITEWESYVNSFGIGDIPYLKFYKAYTGGDMYYKYDKITADVTWYNYIEGEPRYTPAEMIPYKVIEDVTKGELGWEIYQLVITEPDQWEETGSILLKEMTKYPMKYIYGTDTVNNTNNYALGLVTKISGLDFKYLKSIFKQLFYDEIKQERITQCVFLFQKEIQWLIHHNYLDSNLEVGYIKWTQDGESFGLQVKQYPEWLDTMNESGKESYKKPIIIKHSESYLEELLRLLTQINPTEYTDRNEYIILFI